MLSLTKNAGMNRNIPAKGPAHLPPVHMFLFPPVSSFIYTIFTFLQLPAFPAPSLLSFSFSVKHICHPFSCYLCWGESVSLSFSFALFSISLPYLSLPSKPWTSVWTEGPQKPPVKFNRTHLSVQKICNSPILRVGASWLMQIRSDDISRMNGVSSTTVHLLLLHQPSVPVFQC